MVEPTDTRLQILVFIVEWLDTHRYAPTRHEIAEHVGLRVRSSVQYHVETLVADGYLERATYRHRMLEPTEAGKQVVEGLTDARSDSP